MIILEYVRFAMRVCKSRFDVKAEVVMALELLVSRHDFELGHFFGVER